MGSDFISRLHVSAHWEAYVASAFTRRGFFVKLGPTSLGGPHRGGIDLHVALGPDGPWEPVEVKGSKLNIQDGLVLLCAEKPFLKHIPDWTIKDPSEFHTYAWWAFCDPKTGVITMLPKGIPVFLGHLITDTRRGDTYPVVKAEEDELISHEACCNLIKETLSAVTDNRPFFWKDQPGNPAGIGQDKKPGRRKRASKGKTTTES